MDDIKCAFCESPVSFSEYEEFFSTVKLYNSACTGCGATFPGSTSKALLIKKWKRRRNDKDSQIILAEQQLLGFFHSDEGYCLEVLMQSMALEDHEWKTIRKTFFFTKKQKEQIDHYFENKNKEKNEID